MMLGMIDLLPKIVLFHPFLPFLHRPQFLNDFGAQRQDRTLTQTVYNIRIHECRTAWVARKVFFKVLPLGQNPKVKASCDALKLNSFIVLIVLSSYMFMRTNMGRFSADSRLTEFTLMKIKNVYTKLWSRGSQDN